MEVKDNSLKNTDNCIMPEMPYCPACKYGYVVYPDWVETYEDLEGITVEWVCHYGNKEY